MAVFDRIGLLVLVLVGCCSATACTSSNKYSTSAQSGHLGCDSYLSNIVVSWEIELASQGNQRILLEFDTMDTVSGVDFISVFDGSSEGTLLGSYSGSTIPGPFTSSSTSLVVELTAGSNTNGGYFSARWSSIIVEEELSFCDSSENIEVEGYTGAIGCSGYSPMISTSWRIIGDERERIVLHFDALNILKGEDFLYVYDGLDSSARLLSVLTSNDIPPPIVASGNRLYVYFSSGRESQNGSGFRLSWHSLIESSDPCYNSTQSILIGEEGYIGCLHGYGNNVDSSWIISATEEFYIELQFLSMSIEEEFDFLYVYDGFSTNGQLLATLTGHHTPEPISSTTNSLLLILSSNEEITGSGFTSTYVTKRSLLGLSCARSSSVLLTHEEDSIGCNGYDTDVTERWVLEAQRPHYIINLVWSTFDTEAAHDYVTIYDGDNPDAPIIYTHSGSDVPLPVSSSSQYLCIEFISDTNNVQGTGFLASYNSIDMTRIDGCLNSTSIEVTDSSGSFGCDGYGSDIEMSWAIEVSDGNIILLEFDLFFTEIDYDVVSIYDGNSENSLLLGVWSGTELPPPITSSSNHLLVTFESDDSIEGTGFLVHYSSIFIGIGSCYANSSFFLSEDSGSFGCTGYADDIEISWTISSGYGSQIVLSFTTFETEENRDILTIYDGVSATSDGFIASFSGFDVPHSIASNSSSLYISFISDNEIEYHGFDAFFLVVAPVSVCDTSCSLEVYEPSGSIGCDGYDNDITVSWLVTVPEARITLSFIVFDTEQFYDNLTVYDGNSEESTVLLLLSGNVRPPPITSSGDSILLVFHSDSSESEFQGFTSEYFSFLPPIGNCVEDMAFDIEAEAGTLGCNSYEDSVTVSWKITSPNQIALDFNEFDIELGYDTVTIYDGESTSSPILAIYTGSSLPDPVYSSASHLLVVFTSDGSNHNRYGFVGNFVSFASGDEK